MKVVKPNNPNEPLGVTIPYDFDYCGVINASYAVPAEVLGTASVLERLYRGYCGNPGDIEEAISIIKAKKDEILKIYAEGPITNENYKNKSIKYLEDFFKIIEDDNRANREIVHNCR